jgi:hypothetical protein
MCTIILLSFVISKAKELYSPDSNHTLPESHFGLTERAGHPSPSYISHALWSIVSAQ